MKSLKYFIPTALFLISIQCLALQAITGKVVRVADGDTITILTSDKEQVKIRFAGIDCPERAQPWGRNATEALKAVLTGEPVTIEVIDVDRYKRTVGRVYIKGMNVNRHLVESGNCWVYPRYAKDQKLFDLQEQAKAAKRGLWRLPEGERVPPWEWRRKK
jgi:endonuclease YncB( thermonuclease family)